MAQKRMIDKKISVSPQISDLPIEAQLLFTWMIPHADDIGLLPYSPRTIKALVVPMIESLNVALVESLLQEIEKQGLIEKFYHEGFPYWRIKAFLKNQTLKRDRQPNTVLGFKCLDKPKDSWNALLTILNGNQSIPNGNQSVPEVKGREVKRSKDNTTPNGVAAKPEFGDPMINACMDHLKTRLGGKPDGSIKQNRQFFKRLLDDMRKDYPDKGPPDTLVRTLIDLSLQDQFHGKNATSAKYLYYNRQKIIHSAKTHQPKVISI